MPTCWGGLLYGRGLLGCPLQRGHATLGLHAMSRAPAGCMHISMAVTGRALKFSKDQHPLLAAGLKGVWC